MAKYNVMFSCGHEQRITLFGAGDDRRRTIDYYEREGLCSECYRHYRAEQKKEEQEKAKNEKVAKLDIAICEGVVLVSIILSGAHDEAQLQAHGYKHHKKTIRAESSEYLISQLAPLMKEVEQLGYRYDVGHAKKVLDTTLADMLAAWGETDGTPAA